MFNRLQSKILLFFVGLLAMVQVVSLGLVHHATRDNAVEQIKSRLTSGQQIFSRLIRYRNKQLVTGIKVLASDFAFREAVATNDQPTMLSVLENHAQRVNADLAMLISLDEMVIADTDNKENTQNRPFPFPDLIAKVKNRRGVSATIMYGGQAYQFLIVPVKAPVTIAWVGMGFLIDDKLARELKQLTGLEVSFVDFKKKGDGRIFASTLNAHLEQLLNLIDTHALNFNTPITVSLGAKIYISYMSAPKPGQHAAMSTLLQNSFTDAIKPYDQLQAKLIWISVIAFLAMLIGSFVVARGITQPVRKLAAAAKQMEEHGQSSPIDIHQRDEIGQLARAFNHMTQAIVDREEKIIHQAFHDPLTGLPNRLLFLKKVNEAIHKARRQQSCFSIILISLERFDEINYTLGHAVGDKLIQRMSFQLQATCIDAIHAFARLSSNQFVLLHLDDHDDSLDIAQQVLKTLEKGLALKDIVLDSDVHIGLALFPAHGDTAKDLIQKADVALHLAQQSGKTIETYDPTHDERNAARLSLMGELRYAIEQNALELHYQPKIDIKAGVVTHVEALVRWHHPKHGFMSPDAFIPLAEQTGHITRLTQWVLETAIRQAHDLHAQGFIIKVCVNLSTKDLMDNQLLVLAQQLLDKHHACANWFVLEVTESSVMQDTSKAIEVLTALNDMGFDLSIDDYGTGYSSMAYLKQLPVHELKIDKSFVLDMPSNKDDETIVKATIGLGHGMGLWVIAEGVEDEETLFLLSEMHCDMAQGYYICRPLPEDQLLEWLKTSHWSPFRQSL